ncbi:uncharacterized protein PGTG_08716 [Puccinia graminis f. sp. tritici CRL 75-36-700-3]|uniref:Uncharacterized protein n=1 Tax=Puccinia graminis f. sp. tritici (strain CRL 75-36-700-3 / race SCCL) TaxID=418459 RepID=E3KGV5_PUCGT|nr:uncharacterized protein PGTG_08716 [Puccinia graminis f. sp. tritici CRL 75-36-700-3]EFP83530.1 hypothetical protein PGTG_08716 [Puccinia graminis f. sp. tritici CRL 75-36-700-3]
MDSSQLCRPIPSSETKHLPLLKYPLWPPIEGYSINCGHQRVIHLNQDDNCRISTGSTLWLSSQILSAYLLVTLSKNAARAKNRSTTAVEVGAGTVLATDIEPTLTQILVPNVRKWMEDNSSAGKVLPCQLNWNLELDWQSVNNAFSRNADQGFPYDLNVTPEFTRQSRVLLDSDALPGTPIDLIVSADTVYTVDLIRPLLTTLSILSARSPKQPIIYIALERREPTLVDSFFQMAVEMGFKATQVESNRLRKLAESMGWIDEDWEAVEVWKLSMKQIRA